MPPRPPPACQRKLRRSIRSRSGFEHSIDEDEFIGISVFCQAVRGILHPSASTQGTAQCEHEKPDTQLVSKLNRAKLPNSLKALLRDLHAHRVFAAVA